MATKLSIPITLPFGLEGDTNKLKLTQYTLDINKLRELSMHKGKSLEYSIDIIEGHEKFMQFEELNHSWIKIPRRLIKHYASKHEIGNNCFTLNINVNNDLNSISNEYSAPGDIYHDIIFSLSIFLQAKLNVVGFARLSPLILVDDISLTFNSRLAYMVNPWQDWFCELNTFNILFDESLKNQIDSKAKHYQLILPHVKASVLPLNTDKIIIFNKCPIHTTEYILNFGRVLSEIIRLHPSHDYSAIIGMLTAFIEGLLKINGENRYKFKIKISNLLNDPNLGPALNNIYDSRSSFFHSAEYGKINDIFEFLTIDFLLLVIKKIIIYSFSFKIESNAFDFKNP